MIPPAMAEPPGPPFETSAAGTRPASLWPETQPAPRSGVASSAFALSRFDPLAEERERLQAQAAAAFDVCHPALALRAAVLVQIALAIAALALAATPADWLQRQALHAFAGAVGTVLWLVAVCGVKRPLKRVGPGARAGIVLALGAAAAVAGWAPLVAIGVAGVPHALRVAGVAAAGAGLAALLWAWLALRSRIWQPTDANARLAELQSRIRPHFLFNALNTALALVRADPGRAERVLEDLSQLFRVALADTRAAVPLADEIALARAYLDIEQVRFGSRIAVEWQLDPAAGAARVPPLVLQPLVENAVRHGVEPSAGGGRIWVRTQRQRAQVVITVSNTVGDEPSAPGHGMALHNVRERLRLLHDVAAQCEAWREPAAGGAAGEAGGAHFHARITVPAA